MELVLRTLASAVRAFAIAQVAFVPAAAVASLLYFAIWKVSMRYVYLSIISMEVLAVVLSFIAAYMSFRNNKRPTDSAEDGS